ncbi:MAG: YafY family transcriptional regulator [Clostridia bacterium]|nr:YafY family transcriptional regulator [Clostridia bacterium]MBR7136671.1 YafY family transcriptional regulator [Clostridia bacterium]
MKIERLYALTLYLLNHGRTSAARLAEYFEVSVRTIQRDIDSLCLAGIPVVSIHGSAGGYEVSEEYRLERQLAVADDYSYIQTALKGLVSAIADRKASAVLEKMMATGKAQETGLVLDFSALREGDPEKLQLLRTSALQKQVVSFTYTNNRGETKTHRVEPIALLYRWYAWYLLAYSSVRDDYRTYKLVRMSDVTPTQMPFSREHKAANEILETIDRTDTRTYMQVTIRCKPSVVARAVEYLRGRIIDTCENGDLRMELTVDESEFFWFGALLAMGDAVEVLAPESVRERVRDAAKKIAGLYS